MSTSLRISASVALVWRRLQRLRRALNLGEAVDTLKWAIYTGCVVPAQSWRADGMQAVADALSPVANIVMA